MLEFLLDVREDVKIQIRLFGVGYILVCDLLFIVEYNVFIRWYKNGVVYDILNIGCVFFLENGCVLQFVILKKEDVGFYSCIVGDNLVFFVLKIIIVLGVVGVGVGKIICVYFLGFFYIFRLKFVYDI